MDARHPKGLALLKDLVAECDVVTESFAAGTFERWGLGYEVLREIKADIIYVSMCGFGHTGPDVVAGLTITQDQAQALLAKDVCSASACVGCRSSSCCPVT